MSNYKSASSGFDAEIATARFISECKIFLKKLPFIQCIRVEFKDGRQFTMTREEVLKHRDT